MKEARSTTTGRPSPAPPSRLPAPSEITLVMEQGYDGTALAPFSSVPKPRLSAPARSGSGIAISGVAKAFAALVGVGALVLVGYLLGGWLTRPHETIVAPPGRASEAAATRSTGSAFALGAFGTASFEMPPTIGGDRLKAFYTSSFGSADIAGVLSELLDVIPEMEHPEDAYLYGWEAGHDRTTAMSWTSFDLATTLPNDEVMSFYERSLPKLGLSQRSQTTGKERGLTFQGAVYDGSADAITVAELGALKVEIVSVQPDGANLTLVHVEVFVQHLHPVEVVGLIAELAEGSLSLPENYDTSMVSARAMVDGLTGSRVTFEIEHRADRSKPRAETSVEALAHVFEAYRARDQWREVSRSDDGLVIGGVHEDDDIKRLELSGSELGQDTSITAQFSTWRRLEEFTDSTDT